MTFITVYTCYVCCFTSTNRIYKIELDWNVKNLNPWDPACGVTCSFVVVVVCTVTPERGSRLFTFGRAFTLYALNSLIQGKIFYNHYGIDTPSRIVKIDSRVTCLVTNVNREHTTAVLYTVIQAYSWVLPWWYRKNIIFKFSLYTQRWDQAFILLIWKGLYNIYWWTYELNLPKT